MARPTINLNHGGTTYEGEIMRIRSTTLGWEDHGIFTAYLHCEGGGSGQGVGGYALDVYEEAAKRRNGSAFGLDHVMRIMQTVGVHEWENLTGKDIIVLREEPLGLARGFASLDGDRVLIFADHAAEWESAHGVLA